MNIICNDAFKFISAKSLVQILLYTHKLLKNYYCCNKRFLIRNIRCLDVTTFDNTLYGNQDHNAVLIISPILALQLSLVSGCWISARFFAKEFHHRLFHYRWIKVIIDYSLKKDDYCYVSLVLYHNIKEKLKSDTLAVELKNEKLIYNLYLITRLYSIWDSKIHLNNILCNYKASLMPKYATQVNLAYVWGGSKSSVKDIESILNHYFSTPKYVHLGDIISISVNTPQKFFEDQYSDINKTKYMHFVVTSLNESSEEMSKGYLISKNKTNLFLLGNELLRVPYFMNSYCTNNEKVPPCLYSVYIKACSVLQSYHSYDKFFNPTSNGNSPKGTRGKLRDTPSKRKPEKDIKFKGHIMLIGPSGSGKVRIIKLLAEKYSYQIKWINCLDVKGDTSAATEGKIIQALSSVLPNSLVVFTRIGSLSEDRDGNSDPRVFSSLVKQLKILISSTSNVFVIATNEAKVDVSDDIWSLFGYHLSIPCPTHDERNSTLQWLMAALFHTEVVQIRKIRSDITDLFNIISHRTSGFLIGDLEEYMLRVYRCFHERESVGCNASADKEVLSLPSQNDFMKVLEEMQCQRSETLGLPRIPKVLWKDVGGLEEAKKELINTIQLPIKHPNMISRSFRRSGILLYGPPGTGKTLLAKSVASECGLNFLSVKGPELINMYIGQSEENVRNVFSKAKSAAPCVVFFDELDSLAPNRGRSGDSGGVMDRIVSALLAELDGVSATSDVFVLAATNRPDMLDSALLRPGRFDRQIYLGLCETREEQIKILRAVMSKIPLQENISLSNVASRLPFTLTGADFAALATDAFYIATRRLVQRFKDDVDENVKVEVTEDDLMEAALNLKPSVSEEELKMYKNMKKKKVGSVS